MPSRLSEVDLARLRNADARPAGPPPAGPSPGALAASRCVEVDRLVNGIGGITLLNRLILVGSPLAGQRACIRLDGQRHRLHGVRLAGAAPHPRSHRHSAATVSSRSASRSPASTSRSA